MTSAEFLSRVAVIEESVVAAGKTNDQAEVLPKLAELRTSIQTFEQEYESRLSAVQERNRQALENLQKLQDRVARRAIAVANAEENARGAKAQAAAKEAEAAAAKEAKKPKSRRAKTVTCLPAAPLAMMPMVTEVDAAVLMKAVGLDYYLQPPLPLQTPEFWQPTFVTGSMLLKAKNFDTKIESPFVPFATPECWAPLESCGSLLLRPAVAA